MIYPNYPTTRLRRLRENPRLRDMLSETKLSVSDLILPLFVKESISQKQPIHSMPGHFQLTLTDLAKEAEEIHHLGIPGVILFGIPAHKDASGSAAYQTDNVISRAIEEIKRVTPDLLIIVDLCCCEYTDHGHCGILAKQQGRWTVDNDKTLKLLAKQAIQHAHAGADIIAPSGMIDGMISILRCALDEAGYTHVPLLSYAAKYASSFYGPFRQAAESIPQMGDRRGYQMNPANGAEALREVTLDLQEGADILMVKPAGVYLDVIYRIKQRYPEVPLAAYQVSGEFAMIKAAAEQGWINESAVMLESLTAIKRAGAQFILTYFAKDAACCLSEVLARG